MTAVSVVRCDSYSQGCVDDAVEKALALLPEFTGALKRGSRILLKVDVQDIRPLDEATTTHPCVVKALGKALQPVKAEIAIGDCGASGVWPLWHRMRHLLVEKLKWKLKGWPPGELLDLYNRLMNVKRFEDISTMDLPGVPKPLLRFDELGVETAVDVYHKAGMVDAAREIGARLSYMELDNLVETASPTAWFLTQFPLPRTAVDSDRVISVPKVRLSDGMWGVGGAVVNLFGMLPVAVREPYEKTCRLSGMVHEARVDVFAAIKPPPFAVSDAVIVRDGDDLRRKMGLVVASCDCVAHDAVVARLNGFDPMGIPAIAIAHRAGLGQGELANIEVRGADLEEVAERLRKDGVSVAGTGSCGDPGVSG